MHRRRRSSLGVNLDKIDANNDDEETQDSSLWGSLKRKLSSARKVSDSLTPRNCLSNLHEDEAGQAEVAEKFERKVSCFMKQQIEP